MDNALNPEEVTGEVPPGVETPPEKEPIPPEEEPVSTTVEEETEEEETVDETPEPDDDLRADLAELKKQNEKLQKRQMYLQRQLEKNSRAAATLPEVDLTDTKAPKLEDFETQEEYDQAVVDYRVAVGVKKTLTEYAEASAKKAAEVDLFSFKQEVWMDGTGKYPDWDDKLGRPIPITEEMVEIARDLDNPADVFYYLANNLKELTAISRMSRTQAIRALTKVEGKVAQALESPPKEDLKKETKKTTKAPPPIKPTKGGRSAIAKDPKYMTQEEYEQYRRQQGYGA